MHAELWRRFVDEQDVLRDFTDLGASVSLPTPEECRAGQPNAPGWWAPNENGAMFNGLYLDGAVNRALATKTDTDKAKTRRLVEGLVRLAALSQPFDRAAEAGRRDPLRHLRARHGLREKGRGENRSHDLDRLMRRRRPARAVGDGAR